MKNTKKALLFVVFVSLSSLLNAQAFDDGKNVVALGFGFPATTSIRTYYDEIYHNDKFYNNKYTNYGTGILKFEHGFHKHFGMGLNVEYSRSSAVYKYDFTSALQYQLKVKSSRAGFFARFNGHLPIGESLDLYGGVGLGYTYRFDKAEDSNPSNTTLSQKTSVFDFDYQLTAGARYMVKESFGLFFEVGRATTVAQFGVALAF